jgi:hypothetical protein
VGKYFEAVAVYLHQYRCQDTFNKASADYLKRQQPDGERMIRPSLRVDICPRCCCQGWPESVEPCRHFAPNLRRYLGLPERGPYKADCSATHTLKTLNPLIPCVLEPKVGSASLPLACLSGPRYRPIRPWFMLSMTEPMSLLRLFPGKCPEDTKHEMYLDTVP